MRLPSLSSVWPTQTAPVLHRPTSQLEQMGADIGLALHAEGIPAHLDFSGVVISPRVVTFPFWPHLPHMVPWRRLHDLTPSLEGQTGYGPLRVRHHNRFVLVEAPNPAPYFPRAVDAPRFPDNRKMGVPLGIVPDNRVLYMTLGAADVPHFALVGPSGVGKTTTAWAIAYHLARHTLNRPGDLLMLAVCADPLGWSAFEGLPQWAGTVPHDDAAPVIKWLWDTAKSRKGSGVKLPSVVAFLDDYAALVTEGLVDEGQVRNIVRQGRSAHVHLVLNLHEMKVDSAGDLPGLLPDRGVFGQASAAASAQATGRRQKGADLLLGKGDMLVSSNRLPNPQDAPRIATYLVTPDDIRALPGRGPTSRPPWQGPVIKVGGKPIEPVTPTLRTIETLTHPSAAAIDNAPSQASPGDDKAARVLEMTLRQSSQGEILREIWGVKPGGGKDYQQATEEYRRIMANIVKGACRAS